MIINNDFEALEDVVAEAHDICNQLLLFEAIEMEESELREILEQNNVHDPAVQDRYFRLVKEYDRTTGKD